MNCLNYIPVRLFLGLILSVFFTKHASSIELLNARFWGAEDGLNAKNVTDICRDQNGYIWLATKTGVVRFDGRKFVHFSEIESDHNLATDECTSIAFFNQLVWVCSESGLYQINTSNYKVAKIEVGNRKKIQPLTSVKNIKNNCIILTGNTGSIWKINASGHISEIKNPTGNNGAFNTISREVVVMNQILWFATITHELFGIDVVTDKIIYHQQFDSRLTYLFYGEKIGLLCRENQSTFYIDTAQKKLIKADETLDATFCLVSENKAGSWVIKRTGGLYYFSGTKSIIDFSEVFLKIDQRTFNINSATRIDNQLWMGTTYGLFKVDVADYKGIRFAASPKLRTNLRNLSVRGMCEDNQKNLYFASYSGLFKIPFPYQQNIVEPLFLDTFVDYTPYCLIFDQDKIWIGSEGGGLGTYSLTNKKLKRYYKIPSPYTNNFVISMFELNANHLLLGTYYGLVLFNKKTEEFKPIKINTKQNEKGLYVYQILRFQNKIWVATRNGVVVLNEQLNVLETNFLGKQKVICMAADETQQTIWFGTGGNGLYRLDGNNKLTQFKHKDGLPDDNIVGLINQKKTLWISTLSGLSQFQKSTQSFNNLNPGLTPSSTEFNHAANFITSSGDIFLGSIIGYFLISPTFITHKSQLRKPLISSVYQLNGTNEHKYINPTQLNKINVPTNNKVVEFEFFMPEYDKPEKNIFAYKLIGVDADWNYLTNRSYLRLTDLKPGSYQLIIKAAGQSGIWELTTDTVHIEVDEYFYKKWWFVTLIVLIVSSFFYYVYRIKINELERISHLRLQIASDLHDEVGSILTAVGMQAEILSNTDQLLVKQNQTLKKIAETSRLAVSNMRDVIWSIDSKNDETYHLIDRMNDYLTLALENSNINFSFNTQQVQPNLKLDLITRQNTYLIFKECINNIVKHANANHIDIMLTINHSFLQLIVKNDGQSKEEFKKGMGLRSMELRAKKMNAELFILPYKNFELNLTKSFEYKSTLITFFKND